MSRGKRRTLPDPGLDRLCPMTNIQMDSDVTKCQSQRVRIKHAVRRPRSCLMAAAVYGKRSGRKGGHDLGARARRPVGSRRRSEIVPIVKSRLFQVCQPASIKDDRPSPVSAQWRLESGNPGHSHEFWTSRARRSFRSFAYICNICKDSSGMLAIEVPRVEAGH